MSVQRPPAAVLTLDLHWEGGVNVWNDMLHDGVLRRLVPPFRVKSGCFQELL